MLVYRVLDGGEHVFADFGNSPYNESKWKDASILQRDEEGLYYKFYKEADGMMVADVDAEARAHRQHRMNEITTRLEVIDKESARPLRALIRNVGTSFDTAKITRLDEEAEELRIELRTLSQEA